MGKVGPEGLNVWALSPTVKGTFGLSSLQLLIYFNLGLILISVRERRTPSCFTLTKQVSRPEPNQPRGSLRVRPGGCLSPGKAGGTGGERQAPQKQTTALLCKASSAPSLWGLLPTPESCFSGHRSIYPKGRRPTTCQARHRVVWPLHSHKSIPHSPSSPSCPLFWKSRLLEHQLRQALGAPHICWALGRNTSTQAVGTRQV